MRHFRRQQQQHKADKGPTTRHTNRNNQNNKILITKFKRLKADERERGRERQRNQK